MCKPSLYLACLVLLVTLGTRVRGAQPFQQDGGSDGIVSMEAEHYDDNVAKGAVKWVEVGPTGGFTGVKGMQCNGAGVIKTGYAASSPSLGYRINFVTTGTHYVWVWAYGATGNDDSCHVGLDGKETLTAEWMSGWNAEYDWSNNRSGGRATLEITTPGTHTVNIWVREDALIIDKIVLTTNPDFTPTGDGPAESPRGVPASALVPSPAGGATDVSREVVLSWKPGPFAVTHDVYFGAVQLDVTNASRANPLGVLVSQGQDANTYDPPGRLELGKTYYWRIDEVNAPPDSTIHRGGVWSFTVEPFMYLMANITATASTSKAGTTPQNTVNGSGLNASEQHSTVDTTMWLSVRDAPAPTWIQYEFDGVYKLHEMHVWNYNNAVESIAGLGFKDVAVEYSTNGTDWILLGDKQFTQAPGGTATRTIRR